MRRLTERYERVIDDLRSALEDSDGESWTETVEYAMNTAWDEMQRLGDPGQVPE